MHHQLPRADGQGAARRVRHRAGPHHHRARVHERPAAAGPGDRDPLAASPTCAACAPPRCRSSRTRTGAAKAIGLVLPELKGKLDGIVAARARRRPVRSPTSSRCSSEDVERRRDQRRVPRGVERRPATAACSSTPTSRSCRPTSSATRRRASSRRSTRWRTGKHGEGARLVRQRVGLLEPPRRPRRVRRRRTSRAADGRSGPAARGSPARSAARACCCAPTSTCRCATATIEDDLRITAALPTIEWLRERGARDRRAARTSAAQGQGRPEVLARAGRAAAGRAARHRRSRSRPRSPASTRSTRSQSLEPRRGHADREPAVRPGRGGERPRVRRRTWPSSATSTSTTRSAPRTAPHASIVGPPRVLPSAAGRLLAREVEVLGGAARRAEAAVRRGARRRRR